MTNHEQLTPSILLVFALALTGACVAQTDADEALAVDEDALSIGDLDHDTLGDSPGHVTALGQWDCVWAYPVLGSWTAITKACRDYDSKSGQRFWSLTAPRWTAVKYRLVIGGVVQKTMSLCADCNTVGYTTGYTRVQVWNPANSKWLNGAAL